MAPHLMRFREICKSLNFSYFATDRHSTENYITQRALDEVIPGHKALEPYEVFGANGKKWDKTKNWIMFQKMNASDFEGTELKTFITETLGNLVTSSSNESVIYDTDPI